MSHDTRREYVFRTHASVVPPRHCCIPQGAFSSIVITACLLHCLAARRLIYRLLTTHTVRHRVAAAMDNLLQELHGKHAHAADDAAAPTRFMRRLLQPAIFPMLFGLAVIGMMAVGWLLMQAQYCTLVVDSHILGGLSRLWAGKQEFLNTVLNASPDGCPVLHNWATRWSLFLAQRPLCLTVTEAEMVVDIRPLVAKDDRLKGCGLFRGRRKVHGKVHTVTMYAEMPYAARFPRYENGSNMVPFTRCGLLVNGAPNLKSHAC